MILALLDRGSEDIRIQPDILAELELFNMKGADTFAYVTERLAIR
jgi:hypothetical protein